MPSYAYAEQGINAPSHVNGIPTSAQSCVGWADCCGASAFTQDSTQEVYCTARSALPKVVKQPGKTAQYPLNTVG